MPAISLSDLITTLAKLTKDIFNIELSGQIIMSINGFVND